MPKRHRSSANHLASLWLAVLMVIAAPASLDASPRSDTSDSIIATRSTLFQFHSSFWCNMHHFLYVLARARMDTADSRRRAVAGVTGEAIGGSKLGAEQRQGWEAAVSYYERELASKDLIFDEALIAITNKLAAQENAPSIRSSGLDQGLVSILEGAAAAYRSLWWPGHDRGNRDWVATVDLLLQQHGGVISKQVAAAYKTDWPGRPFRVDVCAYSNWAGAYTTTTPPRITTASADDGNKGSQGLETLFHESMHVLGPTLVAALQRAAGDKGKMVPRQLSHAIIFFTAGEITRRAIPEHVPYAVKNGLWSREPMSSHLRNLEANWRPYLEGKIGFDEAVKRVVAAL